MGIVRKISFLLLLITLVYLLLGIGFHVAWKSALDGCQEYRLTQGEFVEPEVFPGILGAIIDIVNWPFFTWANLHHFGNVFETPCDHQGGDTILGIGWNPWWNHTYKGRITCVSTRGMRTAA